MKSLKIKLTSALIMVFVAVAMLIVGIYAAETQSIKLHGTVNFDINDKCIYVQDVRLQESMDLSPYSLKEQGRFMPGYVNGNFNMNLGTFTNTYGSFALYFDIINTVDETSGETFAYTVEASTTQDGVTVEVAILDNGNSSIEQIPEGTVKPSQITQDTPSSASIKVTVSASTGIQVDLSQITITINQYVESNTYDYFEFSINEETKKASVTSYTGDLQEIVIPDYIKQNEEGVWVDGNETDYAVTEIASKGWNGVFTNDSYILNVTLPSTLIKIGNYAFFGCSGLESLDLSECKNLTSIGLSAFGECRSLKSVTIPDSVNNIGSQAFQNCSSLISVTINQYIFENFQSEYDFGYLLINISSGEKIYVPQTIVEDSNVVMENYLSSNFTQSGLENGYYVYIRN